LFLAGGYVVPGESGAPLILAGHVCSGLFLFGAASLIVKSLFFGEQLTFDSILGAICGYLLLGVGWAVWFGMIETLQPGSFEFGSALRADQSHSQSLPNLLIYFSFATLTTVGYGDVVPISPVARTLSWMEAISGQFYLAVVVAGLVSVLVQRGNRPRGQASPKGQDGPMP
jgi:hypothetical protein